MQQVLGFEESSDNRWNSVILRAEPSLSASLGADEMCLCHWLGGKEVPMKQTYWEEDDLRHTQWLTGMAKSVIRTRWRRDYLSAPAMDRRRAFILSELRRVAGFISKCLRPILLHRCRRTVAQRAFFQKRPCPWQTRMSARSNPLVQLELTRELNLAD